MEHVMRVGYLTGVVQEFANLQWYQCHVLSVLKQDSLRIEVRK